MKEISPKEEAILMSSLVPAEELPSPISGRDRFTARLDVYYEQEENGPTQVSCSYSSFFPKSDEQIYVLKINIGEEWESLDMGWIENVGTIVLENKKTIFQKNPTKEELKEEEKKVVFIRNEKETIVWHENE